MTSLFPFAARDWLFALRTFAAGLLALYIAMWIDLPRPYWALTTVYITSQIFAGATRSKAIFRVVGTVLGAIAAVALVPNFVNAPVLLTLVMGLWVAVCLYISLLDRTPASYMPMLAGYTAAIIGFPVVDNPGTVFDTAVSRVEEITLGILCATLASSLIIPQSVRPVLVNRFNTWATDARAWIVGALGREGNETQAHEDRVYLAAETLALDALAIPLSHESEARSDTGRTLSLLRQHMLMYLPIVASLVDRITLLERARAMPERMHRAINDTRAWIASDRHDANEIAALRRDIDAADPPLGKSPGAHELAVTTLAARLRDFIDLREDFRRLRDALENASPAPEQLEYPYTAQVRDVRHRDHLTALLSAAGVFVTVVVICVIWIATAWPDGATAVMMAAVAFSFFSSLDDPAPQIMKFTNAGIIGVMGAAIYLFALLPRATNFEMLSLALAPGLMACGLAMTQPKWALQGVSAAIFGASTIAIQDNYAGDFASFANGAFAIIAGMWIAAIVTLLMRSVEATFTARRLHRLNRRELANAAQSDRAQDSLELAALMLDRVGLIATRITSLPSQETEWTASLIGEVRVGMNLTELRRVEPRLPNVIREAVRRILRAVAAYFTTANENPPTELRADIDAALEITAAYRDSADIHAALIGLYGLRRALFPDAPPYHSPVSTARQPEMAA